MKYYILRTETFTDCVNKMEYLVEATSKEEAVKKIKT